MTLKDKLKNAVIEDLSKSETLLFDTYISFNSHLFRALVSEGVLTSSDIDYALDAAIHLRALKDYKHLFISQKTSSRPSYPDHDIEPSFLAYAIKQGKLLTPTELELIKFDHNEDAASFAEKYCPPNFVENLRNKLLSPAI